jgi:hypothetical protein
MRAATGGLEMSFASGHVSAIVCHDVTFWFIWHWESLPLMQVISP